MRLRTAALGVALVIFGLGAAVGIGLAANSISGDGVGLSAEPLSAGNALAPSQSADNADTAAAARERRAAARRRAARRARRAAERGAAGTTTPAGGVDDNGGS
ncbi:MAG: hypothetical protein QOD13_2484, partial [Thermoleophilaceae bacterium]|nr:hypothetical protein [Thermoleophilaceae bacterium]